VGESGSVETVRKMLGAFNDQDVDSYLSYFAEDVDVLWPDGATPDLEGIREDFAEILSFSSDRKFNLEHTTCEGDRVVAEWTATGTHTGEMAGMPPTGRKFSFPMAHVFDFEEGKVKKWRVYFNYQTLFQQLTE
jgi:steroid delta-isomerase-like uncharacterized protein